MSEELRAAAERLRRLATEFRVSHLMPYGETFARQVEILATEWEANAADDDEPLDESWLRDRGLFGGDYEPVLRIESDLHNPTGVFAYFTDGWYLWLGEDRSSGVWCREVKTRGDVLSICRALAIPLK